MDKRPIVGAVAIIGIILGNLIHASNQGGPETTPAPADTITVNYDVSTKKPPVTRRPLAAFKETADTALNSSDSLPADSALAVSDAMQENITDTMRRDSTLQDTTPVRRADASLSMRSRRR